MNREQLQDQQRKARFVTRSVYLHKTINTKELGDVIVLATGEAYVRKDGTLRRIGVVMRNGKNEFLRLDGAGTKGKAARKAEKRARKRARLAGAHAGEALSAAPSNGHGQAERRPAAPAYSMGGGAR